jgi:hypothetical protein
VPGRTRSQTVGGAGGAQAGRVRARGAGLTPAIPTTASASWRLRGGVAVPRAELARHHPRLRVEHPLRANAFGRRKKMYDQKKRENIVGF